MLRAVETTAGNSRRARVRRVVSWLAPLCRVGWPLCATGCAPDALAIVGRFDAGSAQEQGDAAAREDAGMATDGAVLSPAACPARFAAQALRGALCGCDAVTLATGGLKTDGFDSRSGPYASSAAIANAGDVGINGSVTALTTIFADRIEIGGTLVIGSALGPDALPALSVSGDLRVAGPFSYVNSVDVGGDLWLMGDLAGSGSLHVAGAVRQPEGAARSSSAQLVIEGADLRGAVSIPAPCSCDASQTLDVGALVAAAEITNDNLAAGFDANSLASVIATDFVTLKVVGRVFASSINVAGNLTLVVEGKSTLFVNGDFNMAGALALEIGPQGALDVLVAGNLLLGGAQTVGSATRPAQLRVYVARDQHIELGVPAGFVGHLYAPGADVVTTTGAIYGSIFARQFAATLPVTIHYDTAIASAASDCD